MKAESPFQKKFEERRHLIGGLILMSLLFFGYYLPVIVTLLLMLIVAWMAMIHFGGIRRTFMVSLISFLIPITAHLIRSIMGIGTVPWSEALEFALELTVICSMVYGAIVWIRRLLEAKRAGFDQVIGACNLYVWIATIYACFYTLISKIHPDAFHLDAPLTRGLSDAEIRQNFNEMYYFSFVTQTTLGYGDIVPVLHTARAMAISQAIIGQFYVAVVLTYILNLWIRDLGKHVQKQGEAAPSEGDLNDWD
jgi:hypothetical protein